LIALGALAQLEESLDDIVRTGEDAATNFVTVRVALGPFPHSPEDKLLSPPFQELSLNWALGIHNESGCNTIDPKLGITDL